MRFKKLRTILLASTMTAALTLTGCGSSESSADTTVTEETTETETTEDDGITDETADNSEESTNDPEETETDESGIPAWVQSLYDSLIAEDLDTVFEVIEADDFISSLTAAETEMSYDIAYDAYTMDETYVMYLYASSSEYGTDEIVAVISTGYITGEETYEDYFEVLHSDYADYYITSSLDTSEEEPVTYRSATVFDTWYDQYGLEDEMVYDLSPYRDTANADVPDWVQDLYNAIISVDLDTIYEIIEADDYYSNLTVYNSSESLSYYQVDKDNILIADVYKTSDATEAYTVVVPAEIISGDESLDDFYEIMESEQVTVWIDSITVTSSGNSILAQRYAVINNIAYSNYGMSDASITDLGEN